eukprot:246044_1
MTRRDTFIKPIILVLSLLLPFYITASNHRKLLGDDRRVSLFISGSISCADVIMFKFDGVPCPLDHIEHTLLENHYRQLIITRGIGGSYYHGGGEPQLDLFLAGAYRKRMRPLDPFRKRQVLQHSLFRRVVIEIAEGVRIPTGIMYVYQVGHPIGDLRLRRLNGAEIRLFRDLSQAHGNYQTPDIARELEQFVLDFYYQFQPVIEANVAITDPNGGVRPGASHSSKLSWEEIEYGGTISKKSMPDDVLFLVDEWEVGNRSVSLCNVSDKNQIPKHVMSFEDYLRLQKDECPVCKGSGHLK